jgi:hypothetical protein
MRQLPRVGDDARVDDLNVTCEEPLACRNASIAKVRRSETGRSLVNERISSGL